MIGRCGRSIRFREKKKRSQTELTIPSYEQNTKVGPIGVQLGSNRGTKIVVFRTFWLLKPNKTILKEVLEVLLEILEVALEVLEVLLELLCLFLLVFLAFSLVFHGFQSPCFS